MAEPADERLQAGLAEGRTDAFAALYDCYGRSLFRVAWAMLRSRQDSEDAVQEVFLGLLRSRTALGKVENMRSYLFSALRHATARVAARRTAAPQSALEIAQDVVGDDPVDAEMFRLLEGGLASLPPEQREVLSLKIDGGLTFAEIAAVLAIRPNTAASRYRYALEKLRAALDADSHEPRSASTKPA
jgi:RNA polymerase sigma-70 factor (ECF subfamily)